MRLTEKWERLKDTKLYYGAKDPTKGGVLAILSKLGVLEDVEDELGIDLTTLFKALKNGIWTRGGWYSDQLEEEPEYVKSPEIGICSYYDECDENYNTLLHDENVICIYTYDYEIMVRQTRLKDYGRTWALTKEELQ